MRSRRFAALATLAVVGIIAICLFASWRSVSVDSTGQFARVEGGNILYTHHLSNLTWHPIRYVVAGDPESGANNVLVRANSSDPGKMVTRLEPAGDSPWSVTLTVPGHQQASIEVTLKTDEGLESPGLTASTDFGGAYPTVTVLLRIDK